MTQTEAAVSAPRSAVDVLLPADIAAARPLGVWAIALLCLLPAACYYALLLSLGSTGFFDPLPHGLTFNSMLLHLLQGRFDVDPAAIGDEGFLRDGATYAYFGVFPALFRAAFLGLRDFASIDFTRLSCLAAVCLMAFFKLLAALTVGRRAAGERGGIVLVLLALTLLAGGAQIHFLRPSIFQETGLWADAFAAVFIYFAVRGLLLQTGFTPRLLTGMAAAAGLCLLTRVSTALGLYVALGLLWLVLAWRTWRAGSPRVELVRLCRPILVLVCFAAVTAFINYRRWANPLTFVDMTAQILALTQHPDRLVRVREYGEFNPIRLLYGLQYYFLPLGLWRGGSGELLWEQFQERTIDFIELPPGSLLLSEPLLIGLAIYGLARLRRQKVLPRPELAIPLLAGLLVPIVLIVTAIAMTFRYRLEFYPFLELCAFIGLAFVLTKARPPRRLLLAGAMVSIASAHVFWLLYMLSPFGQASDVLGDVGALDFYARLLH